MSNEHPTHNRHFLVGFEARRADIDILTSKLEKNVFPKDKPQVSETKGKIRRRYNALLSLLQKEKIEL